MENDMCLVPEMKHLIEFVVTAFGATCFQCIHCKQFFDEPEDAQL